MRREVFSPLRPVFRSAPRLRMLECCVGVSMATALALAIAGREASIAQDG